MVKWTLTVNTLFWGALFLNIFFMDMNHTAGPLFSQGVRRNTHMNIFVWNVQGARSREVLNILREHIRMHKPMIMALVETHVSGTRAQEICHRVGFRNWFRVEAQGFQGRIWVFWNSDELEIEVLHSHEQFVTIEVKPQGLANWVLTFVYASPQLQNQTTFGNNYIFLPLRWENLGF